MESTRGWTISMLSVLLIGSAGVALAASHDGARCGNGKHHAGPCEAAQPPSNKPFSDGEPVRAGGEGMTRTSLALAGPAHETPVPATATAPLAPQDETLTMSWTERVAVVAAAAGAMLFMLMRQLAAQRPRPVDWAARGGALRERREPADNGAAEVDHVSTPSGYALSEFDPLRALAASPGMDRDPADAPATVGGGSPGPQGVRRVKVAQAPGRLRRRPRAPSGSRPFVPMSDKGRG